MCEVCLSFHEAAWDGCEYCVRFIDQNPNILDSDNSTPLHYAVENHRVSIAKILMERGADFNLTNNYNVSSYDIAMEFGYQDIIDIFKGK